MHRSTANIISYVFHPLIIATLLVTILYFFAPSFISPVSKQSVKVVLIIIFSLTYIIPLSSIGILKLTSNISSLKLSNRKERLIPFLFVTLYYALTTYLFYSKIPLGENLAIIFAAITFILFIITIGSTIVKVSAHSAGACGMVGFMTAIHIRYPDSILFIPIIIAIIIAGAICSARLALGEHNLREVACGAAIGFFISFGAVSGTVLTS